MWALNSEHNPDVIDEQGRVVCALHGYGTTEGRRNARMILAAPEMYRVLAAVGRYETLTDGEAECRARRIVESIDKED